MGHMANSGVRALCVAAAPVQLAVFSICGTARICGLCRCFPMFLGGSENVMKATALLWSIPIIPGRENRRTGTFVEARRWVWKAASMAWQ